MPIDSWIQYKLSSLYYNCLNSTASDYLTELLKIYKPTSQLRSSSDTSILSILSVRTHSLGQRSFPHAAPAVWYTFPHEIRSSNTTSSFKSSLKTYRPKLKNISSSFFLTIYKPICQLRSSFDTSILCIPTVRTHSLGQRSFSYVCAGSLEHSPFRNQVIQHHLVLQIIT